MRGGDSQKSNWVTLISRQLSGSQASGLRAPQMTYNICIKLDDFSFDFDGSLMRFGNMASSRRKMKVWQLL